MIGIVIIKAVLSLAVRPGSFVLSYSGISYFLLLVLGTCFAIRNGIQNRLGGRLFWALVAVAYALWAAHQGLSSYYELGLRIEVPDNSIADSLLFVHVGVLVAALATLPHHDETDGKPYTAGLNALLVLLFWIFIYGYAVFPYQYLFSSSTNFSYALRFDLVYLLENLALVVAAGMLALRLKAPWKSFYLHLLGAASLYALSSTIANLAIDSGGYVNGKLYGLGLTGSVCWFVWLPLGAGQGVRSGTRAAALDENQGSQASAWGMLVVVMISFPIFWELFRRNENAGLRTLRVVFAIAMIVSLAGAAYIREYLAKREIVSHFGLAKDRLHMAMEAGKTVGWDWDVKSGRDTWFGDLETMFGIPGNTYTGCVEDFRRRIDPQDRERVWYAVNQAMKNRAPYSAEFRVLRTDGTIRWIAAKGQFYFRPTGEPKRMMGMAIDITQHKQAEEALSGMTRKLVEAQEQERARIARELHDDITQRLAILAIELTQLRDKNNTLPSDVRDHIQKLLQTTKDISTRAHALSHELHSSTLERLGLVTGMRAWCRQYGERQRLDIDFKSHDAPEPPEDVSLCLFRVLQEALHNAVKHSGVERIEVQLTQESGQIQLTVSDFGKGFDIESARRSPGLGLTSMQERVRLIGGTIVIDSKLSVGTTIHVSVPFTGEPRAQAAAG